MSEREKDIGVIICDCGGEISQLLDFKQMTEFASKLQGVKCVKGHSSLCKANGKDEITNLINEGANKIVIAACSPKLYETYFRNLLIDAGLNPYCLEMANIREHCSWPHSDNPLKANEKAKKLIAAAIGRVDQTLAIEEKEIAIDDSVLVVGAGIAGIRAAVDIADMGHKVYLIDKAPIIGGNALKLGLAFPTDDGAFCIASPYQLPLIRKCFYRASLLQHPEIELLTLSQVEEFTGSFGNFKVKISSQPRGVSEELCINCGKCERFCPVEVTEEVKYALSKRKAIYLPHPNAVPPVWVIDWENCNRCGECVDTCPTKAIDLSDKEIERTLSVGSIILSTGIEEYDPTAIKQYKYDLYQDVITQLQLARFLDPFGPTDGKLITSSGVVPKSIVMIQCVGSRDENTNPYCSKICCTFALKHAIHIKEKFDQDVDVYVCYIDIRTPMGYEEMYSRARQLGVKFIRGKPSEISKNPKDEVMTVEVEDILINRPIEIKADLVVLSAALVPSQGTLDLTKLLGIEVGDYGFIKDIYSKLKPVETSVKGIYVCGGAQGPKDIPETVTQADAVAYQTILNLSKTKLEKSLDVAFVDEDECDGCELCIEACPYNAIQMEENKEKLPIGLVARIDEDICERCGSCTSRCPTGAIQLEHYTDNQFFGQINGLLSGGRDLLNPKIVAFCCDECGYATVDLVGMGGKSYPANVLPMRVPCLGWVSLYHIFKTFEQGADGILLVGCLSKKCQNLKGNLYAEQIVNFSKNILDKIGLSSKRLRMTSVCAANPDLFINEVESLNRDLKKLGSIMKNEEGKNNG
ncbi:MAG: hydrogenase iron-sulfur subunit [Candidatus Bathyarchaeia archaeon]